MTLKTSFLLLLCAWGASSEDIKIPDINGGGGFSGFGGGGASRNCPSFKCSKGYEAVPKRGFALTGSGCSSLGGGMVMTMRKEEEETGPMNACCNRRSACYQTCGASKKQCDKEFDACSKGACEGFDDFDAKDKCEKDVQLQTMLAGFSQDPCGEFDKAQKKACQCMAPEKAAERREKVLSDVYKKHAKLEGSDLDEKVKGLIVKAGHDSKKFAALLTKLTAKYPEMIKIKKSDQQEYMDKMFREVKEEKAANPKEDKASSASAKRKTVGADDLSELDDVLNGEL